MMLPEDVEYVDDHPEWNGLSVTEELRVANERIAALEAQLEAQAIVANAYFDELQPWREMARQLEALRGEGLVFSINDTGDGWQVLIHLYTGTEVTDASGVDDLWTRFQGEDKDLPAAVADAYGKVMGDE